MSKKIVERFGRAGVELPKEFFDAGVINMLDSDNVYKWNDKKYSFLGCSFEPTITMNNVDDENDTITFAITSKLKDELVLID